MFRFLPVVLPRIISMNVAAPGDWYMVRRVDDGLSHILERHVAPWMRCNMWLVHGRDRDLLLDSGMGLRPLRTGISALRERPVDLVCTHCHFDHMGCAHEFATRRGHKAEAQNMLPRITQEAARARGSAAHFSPPCPMMAMT